MSYRFGQSARVKGEAGSLPGDAMPKPLPPPKLNQGKTRAEQKANAQRVTDLATAREGYYKRVEDGTWARTKLADPEYGDGIDRLIARGSIKRHPGDNTPPVNPPRPGMGELQKSQWRPALYPPAVEDSPIAGALQRPRAYIARVRGDAEGVARAAGQTGAGGFTFGQQAGNTLAPAAIGALSAAPALALPFPANLIGAGVLGYIGYDTARRAQELSDETVLGQGPARQMEASQSYNESRNPLQAIAGRFVGNLAGMRQKPSPKDIGLVVRFFRGQLVKGTPEYVRAISTIAQSSVGTGVGAAGNVATQLQAIREGDKEGFDILPLLAEAGLNALPTEGIGSRAKLPMARPKSFDTPVLPPPKAKPVAGFGETLGPPSPPPGPKPKANVVEQTPTAKPAAQPAAKPHETIAQEVATKNLSSKPVGGVKEVAKAYGVTTAEARQILTRAVEIQTERREQKAQARRGKVAIPATKPPVEQPETPPVTNPPEPTVRAGRYGGELKRGDIVTAQDGTTGTVLRSDEKGVRLEIKTPEGGVRVKIYPHSDFGPATTKQPEVKPDAVPVVEPEAEMLRPEQPEMGLPKVAGGNAKGQTTGAEVPAKPVEETVSPATKAPEEVAVPKAEPDTPEGKARAYVDSLAPMPNPIRGPKPFAEKYLAWKLGGMKGERPSAGAEGITPAAVKKVEKAIDTALGQPTPSPNAPPASSAAHPMATKVPVPKTKAKSVEQRRRGGEGGMLGIPAKKNRPSAGPDADAVDASVNRDPKKPGLLPRIWNSIFNPEYQGPSAVALAKQGLRSDAAVPTEAANILAKRTGVNRKEKAFASEGGLDPGDRVEEGIRRTRQIRDIFEDVMETGPRDEKDRPIGGGIHEVTKPLTEHPNNLNPEQISEAYRQAENVASARAVIARGKKIDADTAQAHQDAEDAVIQAESTAKNAAQRKAAAKMRAELPTTKAKLDAEAAEKKNNIIGYKSGKQAGETDVEVAERALAQIKAAHPDTYDAMLQVGDNMREFALNMVKYAKAHGRVSQEDLDNIANSVEYYVPMKQLADDIEYQPAPGSRGKAPLAMPAAVAKRFNYGEKSGVIENPLSEIVSQTERIVREVERNRVMQGFYKLSQRPGAGADIVEVVPGNKIPRIGGQPNVRAMEKEGIVPVWVDGKQHYLKFSTKGAFGASLARVLSTVGRTNDELAQTVLYYANAATSIQKRLATSHPAFVQGQIIKDRGDRQVISQHIGGPAKNPVEALLNEIRYNFTPPTPEEISREKRFPMGQTSRTVTDDAWDYAEITEKVLRDAGIEKPKLVNRIKTPVKLLEKGMSSPERNNRRAEFRAAFEFAKSKGLDDYQAGLYAGSQATKLQDFTEKGTIARYVLDPLIPFYSAGVEGFSRKMGTLNPIYRDPKQIAKTGAVAFALGVVPAWWIMKEREKNGTMKDWTEYPVVQTAMGFVASTQKNLNNTVAWISKPHAIAEVSAAVEFKYQWDWAHDRKRSGMNDAELANYEKRLKKRAVETFGYLNSPVDIEAIFESGPLGLFAQTKFNENTYTNKGIIPEAEAKVPVSQRPGREGKTPLSAKVAQIVNKGRKKEDLVDIRPAEFLFERFLGRWASGLENASRIADPESRRKALDTQAFWRTTTPFVKDEPGPFSTSMVELEKQLEEATPVEPTLKQRVIKGKMGIAAPDTRTKRRIYRLKNAPSGVAPEDPNPDDDVYTDEPITSYYQATTNKEVSEAARSLRAYPDRRFREKGSVKQAVKLPPPVPTRKESERKKRAIQEMINRR